MNFFYFPELKNNFSAIELDGDEFRHITGVRRLQAGEKLLLFNGNGLIANVEIESISRHRLCASVINVEQIESPAPQIVLASAIPKGERINSLLDMSTQLGMTAFVPLICDRSIVQASASKLMRYNRICINACKQSRRYFVPEIHTATRLPDLLGQFSHSGAVILVADPGSQSVIMKRVGNLLSDADLVVMIVGPEGGFSDSELKLMAVRDVLKIKLSDGILRVETACVCALSQLAIER